MIEEYDTRQAVLAWRDRWQFHLWSALHWSGQAAMQRLEGDLPQAGLFDTCFDYSAFANARIDSSMHELCQHLLNAATPRAANELVEIDSRMSTLAAYLSAFQFENLFPPKPEKEPASGELIDDNSRASGSVIARNWTSALAFVSPISAAAVAVANAATPVLKSKFVDWIRDAGTQRLANTWLGMDGEPPTVLSKVTVVFNEIAVRARNAIV